MKKTVLPVLFSLILSLLFSSRSYAAGIEAAIGFWREDPSGSIAYKGDSLDVRDNLNYTRHDKLTGRLKVYLPGPLPNMYLMATSVKYEATGKKSTSFVYNQQTFAGNIPFYSRVKLNHYDIAAFYSLTRMLPTRIINVELGLNARVIDFRSELNQGTTGAFAAKNATIVVPMVYAGAQFRPVDFLSIEAEGRGILYNSEHYYDVIGRVKIIPVSPIFVAAGYRWEDLKIDRQDLDAQVRIKGPFAEAGVMF